MRLLLDRPVLLMDHVAPRFGRDLRSRDRIEGMLIDVVAARTMVVCERFKRLDRVEDISELRVSRAAFPILRVCRNVES
jgi:hypothetical protein